MSLTPVIFRAKDTKEAERISAPIALIVDGQTRTLLYRYPIEDGHTTLTSFLRKNSDELDLIGVILPQDARAIEVRPGRTSDPPELFNKDRVGYYPAKRQGSSERLEISYLLPPTEEQKALIEFLGKLFAAIITPLVTIILTKTITPAQIARRRQVIVGGIGIQLLVLAGLIYFSYQWEGGLSMSNLSEAILGLGAGLAAVAVWAIG